MSYVHLGMAHIHCWNFYTNSDTRTHIYRFDTMHKSSRGFSPDRGSERRESANHVLPQRGRLTPHRLMSHSAMDEHDRAAKRRSLGKGRGLSWSPRKLGGKCWTPFVLGGRERTFSPRRCFKCWQSNMKLFNKAEQCGYDHGLINNVTNQLASLALLA